MASIIAAISPSCVPGICLPNFKPVDLMVLQGINLSHECIVVVKCGAKPPFSISNLMLSGPELLSGIHLLFSLVSCLLLSLFPLSTVGFSKPHPILCCVCLLFLWFPLFLLLSLFSPPYRYIVLLPFLF